ncbi:MAG TPA: alpha/beta hydrolase [Thermoanaerobaculia bacterium]|nr:alpha/beta hydrolase [Thermoanaerobaculia bacterium]
MTLDFDSEGDGPLVVLLHGFPESRRAWRRQLPALARAGFRAVAPDLRGYGSSPKPGDVDSYKLPEIVGDVAELIEAQGGRCILVGHDWGALVAWFLAMMRPELVERLAILNVPHPAAFARELKRSRDQRLRAAYQLFFQLPVLPELLWRLFGRAVMRRMSGEDCAWRGPLRPMFNYYRALRRTRGELRKLIRRIDVPVLMIWGDEQSIFIEETLTGLDQWIADLRIERIPHARHFVQHDAPERVSQLLVEFAAGGGMSSRA